MATLTTEPSASNPSTPRRASYLSPTKASLSRSHPNLLPRNDLTNITDPRRRRSVRKSTRASLVDPFQSTNELQDVPNRAAEVPNPPAAGNLGTEIAGIFARAEEDVIMDTAAPIVQPSNRSRPDSVPLPDPSASSIVPKLVMSGSHATRTQLDRQSTEPDLPPTPVQLGLAKPPERPTGLASSSSPGGSGRRRVRVRGEKNTSSPLKPRAPAFVPPTSLPAAEEIASGVVEPEGNGHEERMQENEHEEMDEDVAEQVKEKQQQLSELQHELKSLQNDFSKLQALFADMDKASDSVSDNKLAGLVELLDVDQGYASDTEAVGLNEHAAFHQDPQAWLNLFAPGNLQMTHLTWMENKSKKVAPKMHHQITVKAPPPWPSNVLDLTFDVVIDVPKAQIDDIKVRSSPHCLSHRGRLHDWIQQRLQSPVHRRDLAGLVNAAGEYLAESIRRAKLVKYLVENYPSSSPTPHGIFDMAYSSSNKLDLNGAVTSEQEAIELVPFLSSEMHAFSSLKQIKDNEQPAQVMLLYAIDLSWTGKATSNVDIILAGVPTQPAEEARKLFERVQAQSGLVPAFQGIWELLRLDGGHDTEKGPGKTTKPARSKRRATQRFTDDM